MRPRRSTATQPLSELFTRSTTLKFAIALAKPPLKLSLSYCRLTTFLPYRINKPRMEEIDVTIAKYQPLRVLWHPLYDYTPRTILSCPIHPFTRELVPSLFEDRINNLKFITIGSAILLIRPYKVLPVTTKIFTRHHTFHGLAGAWVNPRSFVHSLVYLITRSLISSWISTKFVSALLPCMLHPVA